MALSFRITAAPMYSFTFRRSSVLACICSTRARSFRSMCKPIGAAASPLPRICKRSDFRSENDASAQALAFLLQKGQRRGEEAGHKSQERIRFFDVVYEDGSQRSNRRVPA